MGSVVDPGSLSDSGERCLRRIVELYESGLPGPHLITAYGTAVEVHVSEMLGRLVNMSSVGSDRFGSELLRTLGDQMSANWSNRHDWLKRGFGVSYKGTSAAEQFDILVQLRNAVVHGDGYWSPSQSTDSVQTRIKLRKAFLNTLDVAMRDYAAFGRKSRERATDIAREFVAHFDATLLAKHPGAQVAPASVRTKQ